MMDLFALSHTGPEDWRAQAAVFEEIFFVFLVIGTLVGVIVVAYTLYHAYKYRDTGKPDESFEPPILGELPTGDEGPKSRKLFVSFGLSAILVISLVVYSYGLLLYVEQGPTDDIGSDAEHAENMEIQVEGFQFGWNFEYPNGHVEQDTLRVPQGDDRVIRLNVTATDVWHNFGVTELRIKADSIPGQYATTWFIPEEEGTYLIECFELCGLGHSDMDGEIIVMPEDEFDEWYEGTMEDDETDDDTNDEANDGNEDDDGTDEEGDN